MALAVTGTQASGETVSISLIIAVAAADSQYFRAEPLWPGETMYESDYGILGVTALGNPSFRLGEPFALVED